MLYIASDHAGYQLKKYLLEYLQNRLKTEFKDMGPFSFDEADDYPDYTKKVADEVLKNEENLGILICGSGQGMCIAANKVKGIRAVVGYNITAAQLGREHNNANVLCLAGKVLSEDHAGAVVKSFLGAKFTREERHNRRLKKIEELENE